jgi:hypothetical protein
MRWMMLAATLTLALGPATGRAAQVYKWVDAQGVTHFDAQPPAGQATQTIDTGQPVSAPAAAPPQDQGDGAREQEAVDARVKKQVAAQQAQLKEACDEQRTNLAQLQNNPRVRQEVDGEFRRFTEEERQARIAETKKYLDDQCN